MRTPRGDTTNSSGNFTRFEQCLSQQRELCNALELLADSLPARIDTHAAGALADRLVPTLKSCHDIEETLIFPVLVILGAPTSPILERLCKEHLEDEDLAGDVRDAVQALVSDRKRANSELVGYMLRCLFVSLQRHIAFERDHVLPFCRRFDSH